MLQELIDYLTELSDGILEEDSKIDYYIEQLKHLSVAAEWYMQHRDHPTHKFLQTLVALPEGLRPEELGDYHALTKNVKCVCDDQDCTMSLTLWSGDLEEQIPMHLVLFYPTVQEHRWEIFFDGQGAPLFHCPRHRKG